MKLGTLALLCVWSIVGTVPAEAAEAGCFRIFDATGLELKPDLTRFGIETAAVIYAPQHYWPDPARRQQLPKRSLVELTVKRRVARDRGPPLLITDLEHWPNVGSDEAVAETARKYIALVEWTKASAGGSAVGYYGVPPLRDYWRALAGPRSDEYQEWQAENDRFQALAEVVDVLAPSLYTFYDDERGWERYADANIQEARRLAPDKPVYPFIWPQYHDSNRKLGGQYLPASFWLKQLQTLEVAADGVILWHPPGTWNDQAQWWIATHRFIETSGRVCRR
jgi:hypothetical protein